MDFDFTPVDSLDKVPQQFRSLYGATAGEDGKFSVAADFASVAEGINGFNRSNKELRRQMKEGRVDLSPLAEYGESPADIATKFKEALDSAGANKNADVNKAVEAAKTAIAAGHAKEMEKAEIRNKALQSQLYSLMVENAATSAVAELKGIPELLMPFIQSQVRPIEEDGKFKVYVVDAAGETRYGTTGGPMTIKELVLEMKSQDKYSRLFESEQQPNRAGGGFTPGGGAGRPARTPAADKSANDKIAAGLSKFGRR